MSQAATGRSTRIAVPPVAVAHSAAARVAFLDHIRYLMVVLVVIYHSVAAYATVAPHFPYHDTSFFAADVIRELLDVFMMPVLFFVAGYFALASLEKKGVREFLKDKGKRLLIPWVLAVLVLVPLLTYSKADPLVRPFWKYWLWYLGSFETRLSFLPSTQTNQVIYWFISLLFACFILFALVHMAMRQWRSGAALPAVRKATSGTSVLVTLMLFGVLTSAGSFVSLLLFPDTSWFTLGIFLQFEPTRLVLLVGYFALGVYAQSQGWFADGKPLGSIALWGTLSAVLTVMYLVAGQPLFADPAGTPHLPAGFLLVFACIRSFLILSLLVVLVSVGVSYWNRSSEVDRQLSATSYNIYLTHFWFVVILQESLLAWTGGPVLIKVAIVFLAALALSFAISRWVIGRYPRAFAAALLGLFVLCLVVRP
jgi:peptidoglycan/LPS O-acetylase OafA/YrhL